jgi:hypothetical protein
MQLDTMNSEMHVVESAGYRRVQMDETDVRGFDSR